MSELLGYNPTTKVYYGDIDEDHRLVPAPNLAISHELIYANDIVIGYTPVLTLTGYATSIDRRNLVADKVYGFNDTLASIERTKNIFKSNGKVLTVIDTDNTEDFVLKAIGSTIRSFSIDQSDNLWNNYAPYTIEIEFNEIWFGSCSGAIAKPCGDIYDGLVDTPELLDMKKHRVKSFNDSFSINLTSEDANQTQFQLDCNEDAQLDNPAFDITYTINAVGKHYFDLNGNLMPAWEQAKRFVQHKINTQMRDRLKLSTLMERTGDTISKPLSELYSEASGEFGIISDVDFTTEFKIFNENIECQTSESEGSFSATYTAKAKKSSDSNSDVLHSLSKSVSLSDDGITRNITITVDGTIQGLIETGLTNSNTPIELLNNGSMFLFDDSAGSSAYDKALSAFTTYIGGDDTLTCNFISCLGIDIAALELNTQNYQECEIPECPEPVSYSVTHNYTEGTISYSATFTTESMCNNAIDDYNNVSITIEDSVDVIAEFIIPGRAAGPIIQKIGAKTPKKTIVNIEGASSAISVCCQTGDAPSYGCDISIPGAPPETIEGLKLTQNSISINPVDGSYSISRTYICCEE